MMRRPLLPLGVFTLSLLLSASAYGRDVSDLLDSERLSKELKADESQRDTLAQISKQLASIIHDYQWERGRLTSEALAWEGEGPSLKKLHELRRTAREQIDAIIDSFTVKLSGKQAKRLERLRKDGNLLQVRVEDVPFAHINNTPMFTRSYAKARAYETRLPFELGELSDRVSSRWTYADYLSTWSARGFVASSVENDQTQFMGPGLSTRDVSPIARHRMVQSPLLVSATLVAPDLAASEIDVLSNHHHPEADRDSLAAAYFGGNRLSSRVQVRLKMSTPFAESYLNLKRWIIYLEDEDGTGYEPLEVEEVASRPLEALEIEVPGQELQVTDVFGNYYPYVPGSSETVMLRGPARVVYTGHEVLLKLFFAGRSFHGDPIIGENTQRMTLIVKSEESGFGEARLLWNLEGRRPDQPPKRKTP